VVDQISRGSKWDRASALAGDLHTLLRTCVDEQAGKQSAHGTNATLLRLFKLERKVRSILDLLRPDEVYRPIQAAVDRIAGQFLEHESQRRPDQRLKDHVGLLSNRRARKVLRAHVEARKEQQIVETIQGGLLTWETALEPGHHFGLGMDERVVELPLAFEAARFATPGRVLDAGSSLNHAFLRRLIDPPVPELVHFTQSSDREDARFAGSQVSYVFGDLRSMPFRDHYFDRIVCVSTLEHVGMNNARYGAVEERDPQSALPAVRELMRVLAPGGTLFISVPYGQPADREWFRIFGPEEIRAIVETAQPADVALRYYRFNRSWYLGDSRIHPVPLDVSDDGDTTLRAIAAIRLIK
jgi:SAM-dependent methyltransferase